LRRVHELRQGISWAWLLSFSRKTAASNQGRFRMVFLQQAGNSNFSQQLVSFWKTASSDELIIGTNHFDENRAIVLQDFQKDGRRRYLKTVNLILQKMCFTDSYPNVIDH
ncbi:hypothetical protein, partial [Glutamicibacter sp. NPDC087673]|uniref:hypothetical protein n=1 Tax=Glutamicibacter sp. NPDC087673 TaxID=3363997 RepID=UPI0038290D0A